MVGNDTPSAEPSERTAATSIGAVAFAETRYGVGTYACTVEAPCALAAALDAVKGGMPLCSKVYLRSLA